MTKNKFRVSVGLLFLLTLFSSCLKKDLPDYPLWDNNYIDNVYVEYRYNGPQTYNGQPVVEYKRLNVTKQVDTANNAIKLQITVPAASGTFTAEEKGKVSQNHLWVYMDISTAATIRAVDGTPALGDPTDLTKPQTYEVTAANGQKRKWTLTVTSFVK